MKPVYIFGILSMLNHIFKLHRIRADMIKDCIKDNAEPLSMRFLNQCLQRFYITEGRINLFIVCCIILVIAWSLEDRSQIYSRNAQINQIIQLIDDALQVTAKEVVSGGF
ncbi:hypothetical protein D3C81_1856060 [compost metagenome]